MPAQTTSVGVAFYSELDTAPVLRRQLLQGDGTPLNLTNATTVTVRIAHARFDHYYSPFEAIVEAGSCAIVDALNGWVEWQPLAGDLTPPGSYHFVFEITWNDGTFQTVPAHTYESLVIRTKPGGVVAP